jgi:serine/threonine protein phosphatase 1
MNFVIGDIHGEIDKLKLLLKNIFILSKNPTLIFIGDYIDKGEDPYATLKYLTILSDTKECFFLRGNHEYYWEKVKTENDEYASYIVRYGGKNTIYSINKELTIVESKKIIFEEFKVFFSQLRDYYLIDGFVITHSGIPPESYNTNIDKIEPEKLLFNRYDFISTKQYYFDKKVIFGHTGFYSPYYDEFKIGIDTAACYLEEQPLTAFCIEEEFFIDSSKFRINLSNINQLYCPTIPRVKAWRQI